MIEYYVVLDFEATCKKDEQIRPQEIIEFPSVIVEASTNKIISEFQEYIKPIFNPILTNFCTELTGITQSMVDNGKDFKTVVKMYNKWLNENGLYNGNFIFITCGNPDLSKMYPKQCELSGIKIDGHFKRWINIKNEFTKFYGIKSGNMKNMLDSLFLTLNGRWHSGIDDCRNTARIWMKMIDDGYIYDNKN